LGGLSKTKLFDLKKHGAGLHSERWGCRKTLNHRGTEDAEAVAVEQSGFFINPSQILCFIRLALWLCG
jgi:hypothetical protein